MKNATQAMLAKLEAELHLRSSIAPTTTVDCEHGQAACSRCAEVAVEKDIRISELEARVSYYEEQFRLLREKLYGRSSEQGIATAQLGFFDEAESTADLTRPEPIMEEITYKRSKRSGKRKEDLSALPTEVIDHKLPEEECFCSECGGALHEMGHDSRKELKIVPAQVSVVEHRRAVYSCRNCERNGEGVPIVKAPTPEPVIKGSLASASAVAHIMAQKYLMHSPLYRQEQDWKRHGFNLSRQTMANWVIRCSEDWLEPLYFRMRALLLEEELLQADETSCLVLNEPGKLATSQSYMWLYRTASACINHIIIYEYQPSRSHTHPKEFLGSWCGYLHTDGYEAYHKLPHGIIVVGCWIHLRRRLVDALKMLPPEQRGDSVPGQAIRRIGYLFHLEELWRELPHEERHQLRLTESKPLAEEFFAWLETVRSMPKSALGSAIHYALTQKKWLMNVYLDGRTEFSTNRVENSVRPVALGRKNWLFMNSIAGAKASSVVFSIIETAKANNLKPFEYLQFLFETLPNATSSMLDTLLPWGAAVPEHVKMPIPEVSHHAPKSRNGFHD